MYTRGLDGHAMKRWKDPIVEEVRAARRAIAAKAGNDLDELFRMLRESQAKRGVRAVSRPPKRVKPRRKAG